MQLRLGYDFRPDRRRIGRIVDRLSGSSEPILGCTANDRVINDVVDQLVAELTTFRGPFRREGRFSARAGIALPGEFGPHPPQQ